MHKISVAFPTLFVVVVVFVVIVAVVIGLGCDTSQIISRMDEKFQLKIVHQSHPHPVNITALFVVVNNNKPCQSVVMLLKLAERLSGSAVKRSLGSITT